MFVIIFIGIRNVTVALSKLTFRYEGQNHFIANKDVCDEHRKRLFNVCRRSGAAA